MKKKNHFIFGYAGNKRREVETICQFMPLDEMAIIVEPFCGTSAFSCYISQLYPNKFVYRLNDIDDKLIEVYHILQCPIKTKQLEDDYNECIKDMTAEKYYEIVANNDILGYILSHKHYYMRIGNYNTIRKPSKGAFCKSPIIKFLREETIHLSSIDGEEVMKEYQQSAHTLIYLDPPYLKTSNVSFYANSKNFFGIYNYVASPDIKNYKALIYLHVLENPDLANKIKFNFNLLHSEVKQYEWSLKEGKRNKQVIHQLFKNDDIDFLRI